MLWFGISPFTVIFAVTVILLPFGLINMREGLENLDREIVEMGAQLFPFDAAQI